MIIVASGAQKRKLTAMLHGHAKMATRSHAVVICVWGGVPEACSCIAWRSCTIEPAHKLCMVTAEVQFQVESEIIKWLQY